jgi:hypothetical protein
MRIRASAAETGRLHPALAIAGALALAVAACGGGTGGAPADPVAAADAVVAEVPQETPASQASPESQDAPAPQGPTTVEVGQTAWFAGFKVTLGTATAEIDAGRGGTVTIEAVFENTGDETASLDATLNLTSGGETALQGFGMDIPSVPGGSSGKGAFAFHVEDSFSFDDAILTLGQPTNQQAVLPLTAMAGEAVTQEPVAVSASGSGTADTLRIDLNGGEYRADQPWNHGQMKKGSFVLTLTYDASFEKEFAGGFAFTGENVALRLPDGTTVDEIQDGESQSNELIGSNSTLKDLYSRFEIEDPAAGDYLLLVRSFNNTEAEIPFSIP